MRDMSSYVVEAGIVPSAAGLLVVKVGFPVAQSLVQKLAFELSKEITRVAGARRDLVLTADVLEKFLLTTLVLRVEQTTNSLRQGYRTGLLGIRVPVIWYQVLTKIGVCVDRDFGLKFTPVVPEIDSNLMLSPSEIQDITAVFMLLENFGIATTDGFPQGSDGDLSFMATSLASNSDTYVTYRKDHPVIGFLASLAGIQCLNTALLPMWRISYGSVTSFEEMIQGVVIHTNGPKRV